jgi:hypothetical protein
MFPWGWLQETACGFVLVCFASSSSQASCLRQSLPAAGSGRCTSSLRTGKGSPGEGNEIYSGSRSLVLIAVLAALAVFNGGWAWDGVLF